METKTTSRNTTRLLCEYSLHQIFNHLPKGIKSFVSFGLGLQGGVTLIINTLALVSIKQTNQDRKASLKTTILLSVHDIIATLFATVLMLFFTNYNVQDCNLSTSFVFGVSLVCIFPHSDWIRRDAPYTPYLSVVSPNVGKYAPEKLRIRTLFSQCSVTNLKRKSHFVKYRSSTYFPGV